MFREYSKIDRPTRINARQCIHNRSHATLYAATRISKQQRCANRGSGRNCVEKFPVDKVTGIASKALRDESATAPRRSELDWRRRPTAIAVRRGSPTQEHPHTRRARTPPQLRTTHKHSHRDTQTDKQHKNTTPHIATALINTPCLPLNARQCFEKIDNVLNENHILTGGILLKPYNNSWNLTDYTYTVQTYTINYLYGIAKPNQCTRETITPEQ